MEVENKNFKFSDPKKDLIVKYEKEFYDLKGFIHKHPGGINILQDKNSKSIDMYFNAANHSLAAKYLLNEYKLRSLDTENKEGLEHLVDWNKAMVSQVSKLGENYYKWVNLPVDRPLKFFENELLELMTKTPWYLPILFWTPVITFLIVNESTSFNTTFAMYFQIVMRLGLGCILWTLLEYILHRYVFHINVLRFPRLKTIHFLFHGNHHKVPFDKYRLVFPPIPASVIAIILYQPIRFLNFCGLIAYPKLLLAGGLIGYLCYDMTHYYIHFASPRSNYFYNLKRYHYKHHFVSHEIGFGVSNTFWDGIFSTEIKLNKLKYLLKWK